MKVKTIVSNIGSGFKYLGTSVIGAGALTLLGRPAPGACKKEVDDTMEFYTLMGVIGGMAVTFFGLGLEKYGENDIKTAHPLTHVIITTPIHTPPPTPPLNIASSAPTSLVQQPNSNASVLNAGGIQSFN